MQKLTQLIRRQSAGCPYDATKFPRREFIKRSALGLAGMLAAQRAFAIGSGPKKPNIWIIMSDEHFPRRWGGGQRRVGASSHVDLVKTVIDLGGGRAPEDWNGDSMVPWLDDPKHAWKDYALCEYYAHNIGSGYTMSRSGDWKYTYHARIDDEHPAQQQLFDLATDPNEFRNVADAPENARRVAVMHRRMLAEVGATSFEATEQRARRQLAEGYHRTDRGPNVKRGWTG